ncbi:Transmembrane amino acid transporter [Paratrimastix pyriformis]|uniref:Transmembrane amino acid transporter n=1 Tax=Paratrimastix pyriformis TaxID=342808 RepID=A0ABQ8UNE9_9EUKA|nr:Transmembrane amino acid transporter [Paratrimastix pyriformis]
MGWGTFSFFLVLMAWLAYYSFWVLTEASHESGQTSYKGLASAMGGKLFPILVESTVLLYVCGTLTSYAVIIGDYIPPVMRAWFPGTPFQERWSCVLVLACCVYFPLTILRSLNSMKYVSSVALGFIGYTVLLVILRALRPSPAVAALPGASDPLVFWSSSLSDVFSATPLILVAFTAHYNVLRLYYELECRTVNVMRNVAGLSVSIVFAVYILVAFAGYSLFRGATRSNILSSFPAPDLFVDLAKVGMAAMVVLSYPLVHFAARGAVQNLLFPGWSFSWFRHVAIAVILVALPTTLGILVPDVSLVLNFSGAFAGSLMVYIYPGIFGLHYLKANSTHRLLSRVLIVFGVISMVLGVRFDTGWGPCLIKENGG